MSRFYTFIWDLPDDEEGNVHHLAEHGLTPEDAEQAFADIVDTDRSESSGLPLIFGPALDGQLIVVVYEEIDDSTVYVVTAFRPEATE